MAKRAESVLVRTDFSLLIGGSLEASDRHLDVINPATGRYSRAAPRRRATSSTVRSPPHARVPRVARPIVRRSAPSAFTALSQRCSEHQDALAELLTREQGKPLSQSSDEIDRAPQPVRRHDGSRSAVETESSTTSERHIELHYYAARRRRDHHAVECAHQSRARSTGLRALHGQHRGAEAVPLHAAEHAQAR